MGIMLKEVLTDALRDLRRTWPQLVLADLLARILALAILTPAVGLLLRLFLAMADAEVLVGGGAVLDFLVHPAGLAALLVIGAVSLGMLFVECGALMVIGFGAVEDRRVTWLDAVRYGFRRAPGLFHLAAHALARLLLICVPFLAAEGALYVLLLQQYDIHYYLEEKPPLFVGVALAGSLILAVMVLLIIAKIARWLLSVPMVLFENADGKTALRSSAEVTAPYWRKLTLCLVLWLIAAFLASALVTFVIERLGGILIPRGTSNLTLLVSAMGGMLVAGVVANLVVSVFMTILFPLFVVRMYRRFAGPGELNPEIAARGTLAAAASRIPGNTILLAAMGAACGLAVISVGSWWSMRAIPQGDDAVIIAHRGGEAVAPENTIACFKQGIADRADWIELDVQENADGEVVIAHDRDFMRVANNPLEVWKATNKDLAGIDIGSYFDARFSDQRVPTLREVLELAKGKVGVFIELKYFGFERELEAKVARIVEEMGMESNIVVMSMDQNGLRRMAALRPNWTCGLLNMVAVGDLTKVDVDFLGLTRKGASYGMIRRARARGMKIYSWTINDPIQMSVMLSRGVDGIITDRVALAHRVKALRARMTPLGRFVVWMAGESGFFRGVESDSTADDA